MGDSPLRGLEGGGAADGGGNGGIVTEGDAPSSSITLIGVEAEMVGAVVGARGYEGPEGLGPEERIPPPWRLTSIPEDQTQRGHSTPRG